MPIQLDSVGDQCRVYIKNKESFGGRVGWGGGSVNGVAVPSLPKEHSVNWIPSEVNANFTQRTPRVDFGDQ